MSIDARGAAAYCGDLNSGPSEDCDDGGVCIGGPRAGIECSSEADCIAGGACFGGLDDLRVCTSDDDCRRGTCRSCRPVGGDGCAANCTFETRVRVVLAPGEITSSGESIVFGTSGAVIFGSFLTVPLPFNGSMALTIGDSIEGVSPVAIKTADIDLDSIPIGTGACGCVRGATQFTCGGTLLEIDGRLTGDCTPGAAPAVECPEERPCAPLHGPGNTATGFIVCGMAATDVEVSQNCGATSGADPSAAVTSTIESPAPGVPAEANALLPFTIALSTIVGGCSGNHSDYGPDGLLCTSDDPPTSTLFAIPIVFTTGAVSGTVLNSGDVEGEVLHPPAIRGRPFACEPDGSADVTDGVISGVLTTCSQPTVYDVVAPFSFAFEVPPPSPTPPSTATRGSPSPTRTLTPTRTPTPTAAVHVIMSDVSVPCEAQAGTRFQFGVSLVSRAGQPVAAVQHTILFDNTIIEIDTGTCQINPEIARPDRPLEILSKTICGADPPPRGCPPGGQSNLTVVELWIFGVASLGNNPIPDGRLFTCEGEVVDGRLLPTDLSIRVLVVSNNVGTGIRSVGEDGRLVAECAPTPSEVPVTPTPLPSPCAGDCDRSSTVTVDELVTLVSVALGQQTIAACDAGDTNREGQITVDEIVTALRRALDGCG